MVFGQCMMHEVILELEYPLSLEMESGIGMLQGQMLLFRPRVGFRKSLFVILIRQSGIQRKKSTLVLKLGKT
jgi:hypothetical protein